jgi:hypothetical protein
VTFSRLHTALRPRVLASSGERSACTSALRTPDSWPTRPCWRPEIDRDRASVYGSVNRAMLARMRSAPSTQRGRLWRRSDDAGSFRVATRCSATRRSFMSWSSEYRRSTSSARGSSSPKRSITIP